MDTKKSAMLNAIEQAYLAGYGKGYDECYKKVGKKRKKFDAAARENSLQEYLKLPKVKNIKIQESAVLKKIIHAYSAGYGKGYCLCYQNEDKKRKKLDALDREISLQEYFELFRLNVK